MRCLQLVKPQNKETNNKTNTHTEKKQNKTLTNLLKRKSDFIPESVCSQEV